MAQTKNLDLELLPDEKMSNPVNLALPSNLQQSFSDIDTKYSAELSVWQNRKEQLTLTPENAAELASGKLSEYHSTELGKITDKYQQQEDKLTDSKISSLNKYGDKLAKAFEDFQEDSYGLRFEAIDKGWRTSSIFDNQQLRLAGEYNLSSEALHSERNAKLAQLDFQLSLLEEQREDALAKFDIAYAQKLSAKIDEVTKTYNKENKEQFQSIDSNLASVQSDIGREKAAAVLTYLDSKTKSEKLRFLEENPELEEGLGSWYELLVHWISKQ